MMGWFVLLGFEDVLRTRLGGRIEWTVMEVAVNDKVGGWTVVEVGGGVDCGGSGWGRGGTGMDRGEWVEEGSRTAYPMYLSASAGLIFAAPLDGPIVQMKVNT